MAKKLSEASKLINLDSSTNPVLFAVACRDPDGALSSVKFGLRGWEKRYASIAGREKASAIQGKLEPLFNTLTDIRYGVITVKANGDQFELERQKPQERIYKFLIPK